MATRKERADKAWKIYEKMSLEALRQSDMSPEEKRTKLEEMYGDWNSVPDEAKNMTDDLEVVKPTGVIGAQELSAGMPFSSDLEVPINLDAPEDRDITAQQVFEEKKKRGDQPELNVLQSIPAGQVDPTAGDSTLAPDKDIKMSTEMDATAQYATDVGGGIGGPVGTMISTFGQSTASMVNLAATLIDKPDKERNYFTAYAQESLQKIEEMKTQAAGIRKMKLGDFLMAEQGQRMRNRASARGIGSLRALDLGTHIAGMGARRGVEADYLADTQKILGTEADLLLDRDRTVMAAEERRAEKYQQNVGAYKTNLSQNIMDLGATAQHIGSQMNKEESSKMGWEIAGGSGKYGGLQDYWEWIQRNNE